MVTADFDHDGKLDLATMQGAYINLLHGNGDGSFQPPVPYYASAYPNDIDVGDVNHDGFDDIFTASFSYGGTTQLFLNDGMGSFHPSRNLSIGPTGLQIDGADVDGDGNLDLVQSSGSGYVAVLVGHGDGTFVSAAGQSISTSTSDLRSEDIDGDGRSDMIVTSGNVVDNYGGTVGLTSSDAQATLPAAYTFGKKDGGTHTFDVTLRTVGTQSITASDSLNGSMAGSRTGIQVSPSLAAVASFGVVGFPATVAGAAKNFTVTAKDASGNVVSGYTGTVRFSSSDQQAGLPASYTFTAADAGSHVFSATLKTAGSQSITVVDSVNSTAVGKQTGISVTAAAAAQFVISAPASTRQGSGFKVTLTVYDNYGNLATGYTGKVTLTSTDPKAGSTSYTFSTKDADAHLFSYSLGTVGLQTLTFTDSLNSSLTGKVTVNVTAK